jgi:hypothetical protein
MQKSLAASPLVPLLTAVGAALLIFGTFTNGNIKDSGDPSLASSSSSCDATLDPTCAGGASTDPSATGGAPAPAPGDTGAATTPDTSTAGDYTLTLNKAATIGKDTITVTKANPKSATATFGKKSVTLPAGKATKAGTGTYTYKSIKGKTVTITAA